MNIFTKRKKYKDIDPEEIFIDSQNLPEFDTDQFEGRIEQPISTRTFRMLGVFFVIVGIIAVGRLWSLQVAYGASYETKSQNNSLKQDVIFADRGNIFDRNGVPLAWNDLNPADPETSLRSYATSTGLSTIIGYVKYPAKDNNGNYYQMTVSGTEGLEKSENNLLSGTNGEKLTETDALGHITSQSTVIDPVPGKDLTLSVDKGVQTAFYSAMEKFANSSGYVGGAGVMMDVHTGEIIGAASFPEYDSGVMSLGTDRGAINDWLTNSSNPFLDRVVSGLYTPGSIVKPFVAMGALTEGTVDPNKIIVSTGSISIPNPYDPSNPTIFKDWKALGPVDMRHAIAMSSDVYFYEVGGGYNVSGQPTQTGLGITNIEKYLRLFGFGTTTGIELTGEQDGTIPDPTWKAANFDGDAWRLGDTYHTAIGQYGVQITPLQAVRGAAAIANGGTVLTPTIFKVNQASLAKGNTSSQINLSPANFSIVTEGMRLAVTGGTAQLLNVPYAQISAKTGTAQVGISKSHVNSWVIGFWPSDAPKYAFALVMEAGPINNEVGASAVFRQVIDTIEQNEPQYFK